MSTAASQELLDVPEYRSAWRRRGGLLQDAVLVVIAAVFLWVHARHVLVEGNFTSAFFAVEQLILVVILLARKRSRYTTTRPSDWAFATIGGWGPLLLRPAAVSEWAGLSGMGLQMIGLAIACVGFVYLGRSFGVVAANRGLKVNGPYRLVRHPIYFAHTVTLAGFLLANFSPLNAIIALTVLGSHLMRIQAEERVLTETDNYSEYREQVPWKLLPRIF